MAYDASPETRNRGLALQSPHVIRNPLHVVFAKPNRMRLFLESAHALFLSLVVETTLQRLP